MNILIIGGSRGIGRAAARELAKDGHRLLITGRNKETLNAVKREFPDAILSLAADITREEEVDTLIGFVKKDFPPDGVILNAASFPDPETSRSVTAPKVEELTAILDANVVAHYRIVQKVLPLLEERENGRMRMTEVFWRPVILGS